MLPISCHFFEKENPDLAQWICQIVFIAYSINKDIITNNEIDKIKQVINIFLKNAPNFLAEQVLGINFHALSHLPKYIHLFGPCHRYSAFVFESSIGMYARLITSARGSLKQVCRRYSHDKLISFCANQQIQKQTTVKNFIENLIGSKLHHRVPPLNKIQIEPDSMEKLFLDQTLNAIDVPVIEYSCLKFKGLSLLCEQKAKKLKCCNSLIILKTNVIVQIQRIFKFRNTIFISCKKINTQQSVECDFIYKILPNSTVDEKFVTNSELIKNVCVFVRLFESLYAIPLCNMYEHS